MRSLCLRHNKRNFKKLLLKRKPKKKRSLVAMKMHRKRNKNKR